jgi:hypothetical protein
MDGEFSRVVGGKWKAGGGKVGVRGRKSVERAGRGVGSKRGN